MTQPNPGANAAVDQAHATASGFIDQMLSHGVTDLQGGMPMHKLFEQFGGGLYAQRAEISYPHMRLLLVVAVGRLAGLHHQLERLADTFEGDQPSAVPTDEGYCEAMTHAAMQVRELVEQHG